VIAILALGLAVLAAGPTAAAPPADSAASAPLAFRRTVFATAKDIPNPVSFSIDDRGVVYTSNSLRYFGNGLFDIRSYPQLLDEDVRLGSVDERRRQMERWIRAGRFDGKTRKVTVEGLRNFSEQVRRLEDTDGDGRADRVSILPGTMNDLVSGAAAGVLAFDGRVYATVIPELMVWADSSGLGLRRRVLQDGFGLHLGQLGHDLHGLTVGNDGRIYFSTADRGFDLTTREGVHLAGHTGAVFRCWPDGSGLELWAKGLRNPQELAFTDQGDLFTGDNNADIGDRSRLLYLPEGSDAGWTFFLQSVRECGPWSLEHLWEKRFAKGDPAQPAWLNAAVDYAGSCPAGFAAYPGTGLPSRFDHTLWLADFIGGVQHFRVEPDGAGFTMEDRQDGFRESWGICDFDFGPDGRAWALYWGEAWGPNDKSRLVALTPPPEGVDTVAVAEVRAILRDGFRVLEDARLGELLGHADRRVRRGASFELARRGKDTVLVQALWAKQPLVRMHAIWGLGLYSHLYPFDPHNDRQRLVAAPITFRLKNESDNEVRRVGLTVLSELRVPVDDQVFTDALGAQSVRVRFAAAQALARIGGPNATTALLAALAKNDDSDPMLRFALTRALGHCVAPVSLGALHADARRSVRLGAVLALREARSEQVAGFLGDADPQVATEAARAAYDLQLPNAMKALAASLKGLRRELRTEAWLRRALHSALRVGGPGEAEAVANFAADSSVDDAWRNEALDVLEQWDAPGERDGVWGAWSPLPRRAPGAARAALLAHLNAILALARGDGMASAVRLAQRESVNLDNRVLLHWVQDESQNDFARVAALQWLLARRAAEVPSAVEAGLGSQSDSLFATALGVRLAQDPAAAVAAARRALAADRPVKLKQAAVRAFSSSSAPEAVAFLLELFDALRGGRLDASLRLDVLESSRDALSPKLQSAVESYEAGLDRRDPLSAWLVSMHGGDAERGRRIFFEHPTAQCVKCHTVDGTGGNVGPDLSSVGAKDRRYLLQALITPGATIAKGFESTTLTLKDRTVVSGRILQESPTRIVLSVDGKSRTVEKSAILNRPAPTTAMPPMKDTLHPGEIRDVIEFLAARRDFVPAIPLGELAAVSATTGFGRIGAGRSCMDNPLRVAGKAYARGIGVHAPSRLVYEVPAGAKGFVSRVGVDDEARAGRVGFEVWVDGRKAWGSGPIRAGTIDRTYVEIPAGARRIELRVDDGGDGTNGDHADWCEAGFVK
jgi:quinoprotein glucose dehydrogenase